MHFGISDQFEVELATSYSASYNDDIMSGSMFAAGGRIREGSHVSGSNWINLMAKKQTIIPFSSFFNRQAKYNIGLNYKFNFSTCPSELIADCVLPDMMQVTLLNGGKRVFNNSPEGYPIWIGGVFFPPSGAVLNIKIILGYADLYVTGVSQSVPGQQISDNTWLQTFPFEYRYQAVTRRPGLQTFSVVTDYDEDIIFVGGGNYDVKYNYDFYPIGSDPNQFALEFLVPGSSSFAFRGGTEAPGDWSNKQHRTLTEFYGLINTASLQIITTSAYEYSQPTNIHKHYFGFGDGFRNQVNFQRLTSSSDSNATPSYLHGQGAIVRGWKYGIYNALPTQTKAVWRRGKYGQFRDMLEQRQYTKFYDTVGLNLDGTLGGAVGFKSSVVEIKFISGSDASVTASNSASLNPNNSGIYDFEYKSGRPFFDI